MKIVKPAWISHSGLSIYSIDIHPDGTRLATGGGDAKIKIWSMAPISLSEVEEDVNTPKLLCSIENAHFQTVNCVKWSVDGKYLASGSDDKLCMVWGLSNNYHIKGSVENWVCVATLRAHSSDISEVSWSPDNKYLATCSFDKTIIIWETKKFQMVTRLEEHKGFVKGLTWDPLGRYLASQSEDKSLIIWRTSDWVVETTVTEPFNHSGGSFFLRPSWTPDGQFIVATHGINNATHTGVLISRTDWKIGLDLVGHRRAVVVSRCSPKIYKESKRGDQKFCLILLGGQDSTLSLWSSASPRSLMVTRELFDQSIQDISWCSDGYSFVACSTDGTVGHVSLEKEEIGGIPISIEEKQIFYKNYYGDAVTIDKEGNIVYGSTTGSAGGINSSATNGASHALLPENPDQLEMEQSNANSVGNNNGDDSNNNNTNSNDSSNNNNNNTNGSTSTIQPTALAMQNQKQTVLPSGKRRITPIHIGGSSQNITKPQPINIPIHLQQQQQQQSPNTTDSSDKEPMETDAPASSNTLPSTPFGLNLLNGKSDDLNIDKISHPRIRNDREGGREKERDREREKDKSDREDPPLLNSRISSSGKRRSAEPEPPNLNKKKKSTNKHRHHNQEQLSNQQIYNNNINNNNIISTVAVSGFSIPLPNLTTKISKKLIDQLPTSLNNRLITTTTPTPPNTGGSIIIDVNITEQELQDNTIEYFSVIKYLSFENQLWENKIPGRITLITGNKNWCAVSTFDSVLYIFNKNGSIIMANIVLRNQLSFLESNKTSHLMSITCDGFVSVWNVLKKKAELSNRELPFLKNRDSLTIKHAMVTEETGKPIITFSNGDSFVFSSDVGEWIKITDRLGALSEFNSNDTTSTGILSSLQNSNRINSIINSNSNIQQPLASELLSLSIHNEPNQQLSSYLFLEKQLWLSLVLESSIEYKHWLIIYAKYLTNSGNIIKISDLCTDLLGPSTTLNVASDILNNNNNNISINNYNNSNIVVVDGFSSNQSIAWEPTILGYSKRSLLKEILPIIAGNRNLQRLVGQFKELLNAYTKNETCLSDPFDNLLK